VSLLYSDYTEESTNPSMQSRKQRDGSECTGRWFVHAQSSVPHLTHSAESSCAMHGSTAYLWAGSSASSLEHQFRQVAMVHHHQLVHQCLCWHSVFTLRCQSWAQTKRQMAMGCSSGPRSSSPIRATQKSLNALTCLQTLSVLRLGQNVHLLIVVLVVVSCFADMPCIAKK
jgi:hypothetical protein